MSEKVKDEGETREGRYYPKLSKAERAFIVKEAKRHNVTPNIMLEAMMLSFFKTHDKKGYENMKQVVDPKALALVMDKPEWLKEHEMIAVTVTLYKPFYDFLKAYLDFFGSKQSMEDICRSIIYTDIQALYEGLQSQPFVDESDWFSKWPHIALTAFEDPEEENS